MWPSTLITPRDLLVPEGEPVQLEVEVERRFWAFFDPPIAGAEVEVEGAGTARTDAEGEARIDLGARPRGLHRLRVRARNREAAANVAVIPKDAPVFITDIDHTIADVSSAGFIFKSISSVRPLEGAVAALERISKAMQIVYLTARDHIFRQKTSDWLSMNRFPEAPVYLRRRTRYLTTASREHKRVRLGEIRARFPNIRFGVGDLPTDAEAYAANSIPPILISPKPVSGLPSATIQVRSWSEILERVLG